MSLALVREYCIRDMLRKYAATSADREAILAFSCQHFMFYKIKGAKASSLVDGIISPTPYNSNVRVYEYPLSAPCRQLSDWIAFPNGDYYYSKMYVDVFNRKMEQLLNEYGTSRNTNLTKPAKR